MSDWPEMMFEPARQHPVAAIAKVLEIIRGNFITILILLFAGGTGDEAFFNIAWITGMVIILLVWGVMDWLRFTYRVEDGELRIEQGVFVRKKLYLSPERIQVIDITAGIVQRLFGLVQVEVKTAGSTSKEATISALSREKAQRLKELLRPAAPEEVSGAAEEESGVKIYELTMRDLLIAASTSGSFGVALSIVGTFFSQVDQVLTEEEMLAWIETLSPGLPSFDIAVYIIAAVVVISWLMAFGGTVIKYYGFRVEVGSDELIVTQGLLERKQLTVPFNRIQAVQIREELLRQPFGYASISLESAGYGDQGGNTATLFPLLPRTAVRTFIGEVIPEYAVEIPLQGPPLRALRRYLFRMTWIPLFLVLPAWWFVPYGEWSWLLLPLAWLLGWAQYRAAGAGTAGNTMAVRFRRLSKTTALLKKYRVQSVEVSQNPFQSRLDLVDLELTAASGSQGRTFGIRELNRDYGMEMWNWVSERGESLPETGPAGIREGKESDGFGGGREKEDSAGAPENRSGNGGSAGGAGNGPKYGPEDAPEGYSS